MTRARVTVKPSERWVIIGPTGSGKTEYVKYMLRLIARKMPVVIVDVKGDFLGEFPVWETDKKELGTVDKPWLVDDFNPKLRVQVTQHDYMDKEDTSLHEMILDILHHRNVFVYIDEIDGIATANSIPLAIRKLWKQGRSLNVGAWVSTQVPTGIPRIFKSQASKWIIFDVRGKPDIDAISDYVPVTFEQVTSLEMFHYLFYDAKEKTAVPMPPIPFKEKRKKTA